MSGKGLQQMLQDNRCQSDNEGKLTIAVRRQSGLSGDDLDATIIDISRSGAKLSVEDCLPIGEDLVLTLDVPESHPASSFSAKVCWSQPLGETGWRVGCSFDEPLSDDVLASLASDGHVQRRQDYRKEVSFEASARWESTPASVPVQIVDISSGGFCLRSEEKGAGSPRLVLQLDTRSEAPCLVRAKVQWKRELDGTNFYGCEFSALADRDIFNEHLRSILSREDRRSLFGRNHQKPLSAEEAQAQAREKGLRLAMLVVFFIGSLLAFLLVQ